MLQFYLSLVETEEERNIVERLYNNYEQKMFKVAYSILDNEQSAEDAVHEAFLRIIKNISKYFFDFGKKTEAFLVIIVKSVCLDMLRKDKRIVHDSGILSYTADYSTEIEFERIEAEDENEILEKLPSELRDVIIMRYIQELDVDTISELLGLSPSAVYKRIRKAKAIMEEYLEV